MVQARFVSVLVLVAAVSSGARARPRRAARGRYGLSRTEWRRARAALRKGIRLSLRRRFQEALAVFREGYERWKAPPFLYNEAVVLAQMGKYVEAVAAYRAYKRLVPGDESRLPPPLREAMSRVGDLLVNCPKEVAIFVDGREVGRGHVELLLEVGRHAVELRRHDKVLLRKELQVEAGQKAVWEVSRLPEPRPARPKPHPMPVARPRSRGLHWAYALGLAGGAVATLAAAVGLSLKTKSIHDEFMEDRTNQGLADEGLRYQTAANVMWGLAAASAVAAGIVAIFTDWKALGGRQRERPVSVDLAGLAITVRGSW